MGSVAIGYDSRTQGEQADSTKRSNTVGGPPRGRRSCGRSRAPPRARRPGRASAVAASFPRPGRRAGRGPAPRRSYPVSRRTEVRGPAPWRGATERGAEARGPSSGFLRGENGTGRAGAARCLGSPCEAVAERATRQRSLSRALQGTMLRRRGDARERRSTWGAWSRRPTNNTTLLGPCASSAASEGNRCTASTPGGGRRVDEAVRSFTPPARPRRAGRGPARFKRAAARLRSGSAWRRLTGS